jgi:hypothetical protein
MKGFEINKAQNKLSGHDRNSGVIPIFLIIKKLSETQIK